MDENNIQSPIGDQIEENVTDVLIRIDEDHDQIVEKMDAIFQANDKHKSLLHAETGWGGLNKNALDEMWDYSSDEQLEYLKHILIQEREIYKDTMIAIEKLQLLCKDFTLLALEKEKLYEKEKQHSSHYAKEEHEKVENITDSKSEENDVHMRDELEQVKLHASRFAEESRKAGKFSDSKFLELECAHLREALEKEKLSASRLAAESRETTHHSDSQLTELQEECANLKEELEKERKVCRKTKSAMYKILHMDKKSALANVVQAVEAREKETRKLLMNKYDAEKQLLSDVHEQNISRLSSQRRSLRSTSACSVESIELTGPVVELETKSEAKVALSNTTKSTTARTSRSMDKSIRKQRHKSMPPPRTGRKTSEEKRDADLVQQVLSLCEQIDGDKAEMKIPQTDETAKTNTSQTDKVKTEVPLKPISTEGNSKSPVWTSSIACVVVIAGVSVYFAIN